MVAFVVLPVLPMFYKDSINGLPGPFRLHSVMAGKDVTLSHFNEMLPYFVDNGQLRHVDAAMPFGATLTAFPLTPRAALILLQADACDLHFAPSATPSRVPHPQWYVICVLEYALFTSGSGQFAVQPGDVLLVHSQSIARLRPQCRLRCIIVAMQQPCVEQRQALFRAVSGHCFAAHGGWARVLSVYLRELNETIMDRVSAVPSDQAICLDTLLSMAAMMFEHRIHDEEAGLVVGKRRQARSKLYFEITLWLSANFAEAELTGAKVASEFGISVRTLHKLFREFNDSASFAVFLNNIRMQNARKLLWDSSMRELTMADIGWRCGFSDPAHFGKVFKKYHSLTPKQMRDTAPRADHFKP